SPDCAETDRGFDLPQSRRIPPPGSALAHFGSFPPRITRLAYFAFWQATEEFRANSERLFHSSRRVHPQLPQDLINLSKSACFSHWAAQLLLSLMIRVSAMS